jgi:hypothetical protein
VPPCQRPVPGALPGAGCEQFFRVVVRTVWPNCKVNTNISQTQGR